MVRYLFPGDLVLLPDGDPAVDHTYTWWTDPTSGTGITDVLADDGITPITTLVTDSDGLRPYQYGPDGVEVMYCDTGASIRFPVTAVDRQEDVLDQAALLDTAQTFSALQTFSSGVTVSGGSVTLPDASLAIADTSGLQAALDALAALDWTTAAIRSLVADMFNTTHVGATVSFNTTTNKLVITVTASGGGGGLDTAGIDNYMGGSMSQYLLRSVGVRYRADPDGPAAGNPWEARPTCKLCIAIGEAPMPTALEGRQVNDLFFPRGAV
jgi:hypothetical protein